MAAPAAPQPRTTRKLRRRLQLCSSGAISCWSISVAPVAPMPSPVPTSRSPAGSHRRWAQPRTWPARSGCYSSAWRRFKAMRRPSTTPPPMPFVTWRRYAVALGAPQLDLIGISYGTRVAQQYAARYPSAVRSVVLDSAVPNALVLGSDHARNLEQALRSLFARCSADARCKHNFGDSYATLYRVRDRLRAQPQAVSLRDPISFEPLQLTLQRRRSGDHRALLCLQPADRGAAAIDAARGRSGQLRTAAQPEEVDRGQPGQRHRWRHGTVGDLRRGRRPAAARPEDAATLLGNDQIAKIQAACSIWPRGQRPADFHQPLASALPVLLLAGEHDPVTPPAYAQQILATLPTCAACCWPPGRVTA